ncbi:hypothetical protein [Gordonia sp. (in: high G+C Gram-positive bacteria)]|uniref:hypothetical protein n=1 Tax=Gordonia sp. (in: high G+C Gram-positive bacteria) TaxID=84139 RepID=UPI003C70721A
MSPRSLRNRLAGIAAAAAVVGVGLVAVPTPVAGTAAAAECRSSSSETKSLIVPYGFQKSVPGMVAEGGTVSYSLSVSTESIGNPYVQGVWDIPPTVLKDVKPVVKIKSYTLVGGILGGGGALGPLINQNTVNPADVKQDGISWKVKHTGWAVFAGKSFTAEFTYKLPKTVSVGTQLQSGGAAFEATPKPPLGYLEFPNLTACTTVRGQNAGESIGGSLDDNGLGSAEGQLSSTGSLADMIPGIIGGIMG